MTADPVDRIEELFHEVLKQEQRKRTAFLAKACGDDFALLAKVKSLIANMEEASDFFDKPAWAPAPQREDEEKQDSQKTDKEFRLPFERIGEFKLIRQIGEGGMGVVYLAEQEPLGRHVALKIIRPERTGSVEISERFWREVEAVSKLRHRNIVTLYGSGEENGVPYFAMELLPGRGLDEVLADAASRNEKVPTRQALRWIRDIAMALNCAHQAGIIHRDLKPSNIRIAHDDQAMLMDFGIARHTKLPSLTLTGEFRGTLHYASPEQVRGHTREIDVRTDIYSLGVALYHVVTGRVPFEGETTEQVFRNILEKDPEPPRRLNPAISRDVETVTLKAVEKDRDRRYQTVAAFADDIERILNGEVVLAKPAGFATKFWKRIKRNPVVSGSAVVALIAAMAFALVLPWVIATKEREKGEAAEAAKIEIQESRNAALAAKAAAEEQARIAEQVILFLINHVLPAIDPAISDDSRVITEILNKAGAPISSELKGTPAVEVRIRRALGEAFMKANRLERAEEFFVQAFEQSRACLGKSHPETLRCHYLRLLNPEVTAATGKMEQAWKEYLSLARPCLGDKDPDILGAIHCLSSCLRGKGKLAEASDLLQELSDGLRKKYGEENQSTAAAMHLLSVHYLYWGNAADRQKGNNILRRCFEIQRRVLGRYHRDTLKSAYALAGQLGDQGDYKEQLELRRDLLEGHQRWHGPEDRVTLFHQIWLAEAIDRTGRFEEAQHLYRRTLDETRRILGKNDIYTSLAKFDLAVFLTRRNQYDEAIRLHREALSARRKARPEDWSEHWSMHCLAETLRRKGKFVEAKNLHLEAQSLARAQKQSDNERRFSGSVARLFEDMDDHEEAERFYRRAIEITEKLNPPQHPDNAKASLDYARYLNRCAKYAAAEQLLRKALEVFKDCMPRHYNRFVAASALGMALAGQGKYEEAEPLLLDGHEGLEAIPYAFYADEGLRSIECLVKLYELQEQPVQMKHWQAKLADLQAIKAAMARNDYSLLPASLRGESYQNSSE